MRGVDRLFADNRRVPELIVAYVALVTGVVYLLPGDTFARAQAYRYLKRIAPEWVWGAFLVTLGVVLAVTYFVSALSAVRRGALMVAVVANAGIAAAYFFGNPLSVGPWTSLMYASLAVRAYVKQDDSGPVLS